MFRNKFNPKILAVVLIALLCFFLPDIYSQTKKDTTKMGINYDGYIWGDYQPTKRLWIENGKVIIISVARFNNLTRDNEWELLDVYYKNDCYMTKWKNKKSGEEFEGIGTYPPNEWLKFDSTRIDIGTDGFKTNLDIKKPQGKK